MVSVKLISFVLISICKNSQNVLAKSRDQRFAPYMPFNSGLGMGIAIQLPLDDGSGNVEFSICMEANYNQPNFEPSLEPELFQTWNEGRKLKDDNDCDRKAKKKSNREKSILHRISNTITRKAFFETFVQNVNRYGYNGKHCLLRTICEASLHQYGNHNGLVGDLIHVLFTPSTSRDENFSKKLYKAEEDGVLGSDCEAIYGKKCPLSVLELITMIKS